MQMAKIPIDENLAAILVAAQYVVGYSLSSMFVTRFAFPAVKSNIYSFVSFKDPKKSSSV